jgi:membrane protein DedA with SNARE-associated domain
MVAGGLCLCRGELFSGSAASAFGDHVPGRAKESIATAASVLGGLLGYAIGHFLYDTIGTQLLALLGLSESFPRAACYLREYGAEIIMIKGATPIPFKLLTITAGFISMPLATFIGASIVSRSISFLIVGVLFRMFGAPIKAFIDKYLGLATAGFVVLVVGGFIAASMLGGGASQTSARCEAIAAQEQAV